MAPRRPARRRRIAGPGRRAIPPRVAGLHCSGTPTYDLYRHLCRDTILFFANRAPASEIIGEAALAGRLEALRSGAPPPPDPTSVAIRPRRGTHRGAFAFL